MPRSRPAAEQLAAGGITFLSMEQFMMYRKAICFCDASVVAQILAADDAGEIKLLVRKVSNYDEHIWNGVRQIVVYEGLMVRERS